MSATGIDSIYSDFVSSFVDDPEFIIDFYEQHALYFKNISRFSNKEELRLFVELNWQYLNAIYMKDRFNETVDLVNVIQPLIDSEIIRLTAFNLKNDWYYGICFFKGMASYRLRDYKTATPIFKILVNLNPKNDNYKNWLSYSSYSEKQWLINILNFIFLICSLSILFFKQYIPNYYIRQALLLSSLLGLFTLFGYDFYVKRSFRKSKKY